MFLGASNILRVTDAKYCDALRAYMMVVVETTSLTLSDQFQDAPEVSFLTLCWLERACFGLAALVMQCELSSGLGVLEPSLTSS